jgi:hypothetical protein
MVVIAPRNIHLHRSSALATSLLRQRCTVLICIRLCWPERWHDSFLEDQYHLTLVLNLDRTLREARHRVIEPWLLSFSPLCEPLTRLYKKPVFERAMSCEKRRHRIFWILACISEFSSCAGGRSPVFLHPVSMRVYFGLAAQREAVEALVVPQVDEHRLDGGDAPAVERPAQVWLPDAIGRKHPGAGKEWGWRFVFPSQHRSADPDSGVIRRHHIFPDTVGRAVKRAARAARRCCATSRKFATARHRRAELDRRSRCPSSRPHAPAQGASEAAPSPAMRPVTKHSAMLPPDR